MDSALLFLIKLAWESRYRIPMIITLGFMALDIRMQLEINVNVRSVRRQSAHQRVEGFEDVSTEDDSDSWYTISEESEAGDQHDDETTVHVEN